MVKTGTDEKSLRREFDEAKNDYMYTHSRRDGKKEKASDALRNLIPAFEQDIPQDSFPIDDDLNLHEGNEVDFEQHFAQGKVIMKAFNSELHAAILRDKEDQSGKLKNALGKSSSDLQ